MSEIKDTGSLEIISKREAANHTTKKDLWVILHNQVYNVTPYIEDHPGGVSILLESAGQDCTEAFEDIGHSTDAREVLEKYLIGRVPDDERTETLVKTVAEVIPQDDRETESQNINKKHIRVMLPTISTGLLLITSLIWVGGRVIRGVSTLQSSGGFWVGFGISSLASISMVMATGVWFNTLLRSKAKDSFPTRIKPGISVAKRRSINSGVMNPRQFRSFPLIEKHQISPDTYRFVFGLPEPGSLLGLPTGQHVYIRHENAKGEMVSRSYTPVSTNRERGRMELVVKTYPNGFMSQYLANLAIGDKADFRGPGGKMKYTRYLTREIGMIAGGSGITPMFSIIKAVCTTEKDNTKISLLFANKTEDDILLRKELDEYAQKFPHKFKVWYIVDTPPPAWQYGTGRIDENLIKKRLPSPNGEDSKILLCGPPGMQKAMVNTLVGLGFRRPSAVAHVTDEIFVF
ncbi:hypothetical protein BDV37DRAFT_279871 [Aspergillus pseudonomiae]|uniref:NADH-cytochrome b5 reductase 1 n=1 Tax=Aspergillus pseudonomiae TaxID=1506151 RepID=A0A5N7DPD8_9EURO|nr:uncharacterized protein BDV37DRAFT_279871 [Aspergillus pseudonomiae]KAE8407338.1 hypothetical protein BDV37DRAFT_279871 [Aspergillus pseudonomiae]